MDATTGTPKVPSQDERRLLALRELILSAFQGKCGRAARKFNVQGSAKIVQGSTFKVQGSAKIVQGSTCNVQSSRFGEDSSRFNVQRARFNE